MGKIKKIRMIGLLLLGMVIVLNSTGCILVERQKNLEKHQEQIEAYLEEKYGLDFTVDKPYVTGNAGFGNNLYATATTTYDGQEIKCRVTLAKKEGVQYEDDYQYYLWMAGATPEIKKTVQKYYDQSVYFDDVEFIAFKGTSTDDNFEDVMQLIGEIYEECNKDYFNWYNGYYFTWLQIYAGKTIKYKFSRQ